VDANISQITNNYTSHGELEKLTEAIYPPGSTTPEVKESLFTWQSDGVLKKHKIDGEESQFGHRLDRLESSFTPFNGTAIFEAKWFDNGSLEQLKLPNGAKIDNLYDSVSRLENRQVTAGSTVISAWTDIDYDDNGNRLSELTSQLKLDGSELRVGTATNSYDQLDRLISNHHAFDTGDTKVGYTLDNAGNVTAEAALDGPAADIQGFVPTIFGYTNNRLAARTPTVGDAFSYQYDDSGNQKFERKGTAEPPVGTLNTYDAGSHPQRTTTPEGNWAEYTYDGLGRQVTRKTDSGETTLVFHFGLVDQSAVEQTTGGPADAKTTRYLLNSFGAPLGQQVTVHASPDVVSSSYFVPDLRGNLSQLLGSSSTGVKGIFAYDPYGKPKQELELNQANNLVPTADSLTSLEADSDSRLRYQMAPHDPLTGNYNLGPRLLNPNINRFVGADFYAAGAANMALQVDPLTGNRYMYAGANPAGLIDDGHKFGPFECFGPKDADGGCAWNTDLKEAPEELGSIPSGMQSGAKELGRQVGDDVAVIRRTGGSSMAEPFKDHIPLATVTGCALGCSSIPVVSPEGVAYGVNSLDNPDSAFAGVDIVGTKRAIQGVKDSGPKGGRQGLGASIETFLPIEPVKATPGSRTITVEGCYGLCGGVIWNSNQGLIVIVGGGLQGLVVHTTRTPENV
jgi:RHS repeat-associated protein